jgi:hypothetical protein
MQSDVTWKYFNALKEKGEDVTFSIVCFHGERPFKKLCFDHRRYDGVSALCEMARGLPQEGFIAPELKSSPRPHVLRRISYFALWWLRLWPGVGKAWRKRGEGEKAVSAFIHIDRSQWKGGGTAVVLAALDKTSQRYLAPSLWPRLWMVPVALYSQVKRDLPPQNNVAFVDVRLFSQGDVHTITKQMHRDLRQQLYWGTGLTLNAALLFGTSLFKFSLNFLHHFFRRTGTLTNLGAWTMPGLPDDEWWAIQLTVATLSPVGAGMMEINGQLGLGVQFHPTLQWNEAMAKSFVEEWKNELLSEREKTLKHV